MAEIWYGMGQTASTKDSCGGSGELSSRVARRRRRMELRRMRFLAGAASLMAPTHDSRSKRPRLDGSSSELESAALRKNLDAANGLTSSNSDCSYCCKKKEMDWCPKYAATSICGRRRQMEDAVSIHPGFLRVAPHESYNFFAVFDGHGCSHVAGLCKESMHEIVAKELEQRHLKYKGHETEIEKEKGWWREAMEKCFAQMDKEAVASASNSKNKAACSCEMQMPRCDHVGSTAVVAVVGPRHVVVANCGDSRAVLCRNGSAIPLSVDHKPDRPDELQRIQAAGGRVIYWDGARVFGVLAMSRAIGDSYLKPFVICEPEVTVTEVTEEDECLILASDGLWDVVPNQVACEVARRCLLSSKEADEEHAPHIGIGTATSSSSSSSPASAHDKACADAAMLLTKLALARHTTDNVSVVVIDLRRR